jgi:D-alanyl-D-alanine carboxypeptidase
VAGKSPGRAEQTRSSGETAKTAKTSETSETAEMLSEVREVPSGEESGSQSTLRPRISGDYGGHVKKVASLTTEGGRERPVNPSSESASNDEADAGTSPIDSPSDAAPAQVPSTPSAPSAPSTAATTPAQAAPETGERAASADKPTADDVDLEPSPAAKGGKGAKSESKPAVSGGAAKADTSAEPLDSGRSDVTTSSPGAAKGRAAAEAAKAKPAVAAEAAEAGTAVEPVEPADAADTADAASAEAPLERTKQQPLPPLPGEPLKLLAELTNTPPPPETLVRTAVRRIKIWTPLVALLAIIFCVVQAGRPLPRPKLALTGASSYTFPGAAPSVPWPGEGQAALEVEGLGSMGTYGQQKPVPIASVAKVMTAYIILRDHPLTSGQGPKITVDQQAVNDFGLGTQGESVVKVTEGEQISEYEALEDIMIASANNVARLLGRWDAGSDAAFVQKMNTTAKELGMSHSTYTDPSGLTATTVSTASDQLKLAQQAMGDATFRKVVAQPNFKTASGDSYNNWNHLVGTDSVIGVKTGTTPKAGGNLVFAATKSVGGTTQFVLGVVLGQYKPPILDTVTAASLHLIVAAQQSLTTDQIIKKGDVVGYVDDGLGGKTPVVATQDVQAVGWAGNKVAIALAASPSGIPHSAKAGTTVGTLTVGGGPGQVKVPVALHSDLNTPSFGAKLTRLG